MNRILIDQAITGLATLPEALRRLERHEPRFRWTREDEQYVVCFPTTADRRHVVRLSEDRRGDGPRVWYFLARIGESGPVLEYVGSEAEYTTEGPFGALVVLDGAAWLVAQVPASLVTMPLLLDVAHELAMAADALEESIFGTDQE
jgi:hypothetical protein